jgi:hypothetical protein
MGPALRVLAMRATEITALIKKASKIRIKRECASLDLKVSFFL